MVAADLDAFGSTDIDHRMLRGGLPPLLVGDAHRRRRIRGVDRIVLGQGPVDPRYDPRVERSALVVVLALVIACGNGSPPPAGEDSEGASSGSAGSSGSAVDSTGSSSAGASSDAATTTTTADTSGTDTSTAPFEHEFHTLLTDDGRLALHSNLPPAVDACLALPFADPPCDDLDADGLVDAWEDVVLDRLRPLRRLDEAESAVEDPAFVHADVGRVAAAADDTFRLMVMLGYSRDYGSCGFTAHNGDSERVVLALAPWPVEGEGGVVMDRAYTAAHEGAPTDHGRTFVGDQLAQLVFTPDPAIGQPRWVVFPSADKHATYATVEICEGISPIPCLDEDCGPDGVDDPTAFDVLPLSFNAGEIEAPRLTDLALVGFPGDDAWADQDFCGGLGGTGCSSSVRSKLLVDPFE
jgi:hypothetical protein